MGSLLLLPHMPPEQKRSYETLHLKPPPCPWVLKLGILLISSPPFMKNKGCIHIHHFGDRMFMPKVFCHLNGRIFHACFLKLMLVHAAEENVLIVEAVLVLLPFQIGFSGKFKEPFAAQGDAVSHPAQVSVDIVITVLRSR